MKQSQVLCVEYTNGELHLILKDLGVRLGTMNVKNLDEAITIKKIMEEETIKPLFLIREE